MSKTICVVTAVFVILLTFGCTRAAEEEVIEGEMAPAGAADVKVNVLNACGDPDAVSGVADKLKEAGYEVNAIGQHINDDDRIDYSLEVTEIFTGPDGVTAADAIAELLGGEVAADPGLSGTVEVLVGRDLSGFSPTDEIDEGIYVSLGKKAIYEYEGGELARVYPCAIGKEETPSPPGTYNMYAKSEWPTWYWEGEAIPPGPENGLGARFLGISNDEHPRGYGLHGTNEPDSIGTAASHGCIRTYNEYIEEMYETVAVGETVIIGD
ncbi:MAG: L,D-transpeptidase family protein [bacterium]|nr:L,D-transpeptidase family protein [bacterium]